MYVVLTIKESKILVKCCNESRKKIFFFENVLISVYEPLEIKDFYLTLIVNFIYSLVNPENIQNLYQKLDIIEIYKSNKWIFFGLYSFILIIAFLKAYLFYVVIRLVSKIDLSRPFNKYVSKQISLMSYYSFSIGLLSYIARQNAINLQHRAYDINTLNKFWADSQAYILMAAIIYIIAIIFQKGLEYQTEIDETV
jgi:hypothetical protein